MSRAASRAPPVVPQMAAAFDFAEDGETFTGLGLPPVDKYTQRAEASGALCRLGATHPKMSQGALCKKVQHQVSISGSKNAEIELYINVDAWSISTPFQPRL